MKVCVSYYAGRVATRKAYPHLLHDDTMDHLVDIVSAFEEKHKITIDFLRGEATFELRITDVDLNRDIGRLAEDLLYLVQQGLKR